MVDKVDKSKYAKGWFCTWPKCPIGKEMCLEELKAKWEIVEYVICEETHADGEPHLHAFLKLDRRVNFKASMFDVAGYHGNYQVAKSWRAVQAYVKKDGDFITNIDLDAARAKKAAHNAKLLELDPKKAVDGVEHVYLVYRRTKRYMPADEHELVLAVEDGVYFSSGIGTTCMSVYTRFSPAIPQMKV